MLLGSGIFHDAISLARLPGALSYAFTDAAWTGSDVLTLRETSGSTQLQKWIAPSYSQGAIATNDGLPYRILPVGEEKFVGIFLPAIGIPEFQIYDSNLRIVAPSALEAPALVISSILDTREVQLTWTGVTGAAYYDIERSNAATPEAWENFSTAKTTSFKSALVRGQEFFFRVRARNGTLISAPSAAIRVAARVPMAPADSVAVVVPDSNSSYYGSVQVSWTASEGAATYRVEQRRLPSNQWSTGEVVTAPTSNYSATYLSSGFYEYRVIAINAFGESTASAVASVTVGNPSPVPTPTPAATPSPTPSPSPSPTPNVPAPPIVQPLPAPTPIAGPRKDRVRPEMDVSGNRRRITGKRKFIIGGTATDNRKIAHIEITRDGRTRKIRTQGRRFWFARVKLQAGRNVFTMSAFDRAGNESKSRRVVVIRRD